MKTLVVGYGSIGRRHVRNLHATGLQDVIVFDSDPQARRQALKAGVDQVAETLEEGLDRHPAVAFICMPPFLHVPHSLQCLDAGCHLYLEKPVSHSLAGVEGVLDRADAEGRVIQVGFQLRFDLTFGKVKALLESGAVGRPVWARAEFGQYYPDWRPGTDFRKGYGADPHRGGGVLLDACHDVDILRWLLGDVVSVSGGLWRDEMLGLESEDLADLGIEFESGCRAQVHLDRIQRGYHREGKVVGTEGVLLWDYAKGCVTWINSEGSEERFQFDPDRNAPYVRAVEHFLKAVRGEAEPMVSGWEGFRCLEVCLAARHASEILSPVALRSRPREPKVVVIVQARMGSTRFPGKVLAPLCGRPVLAHVLERARLIRRASACVIATTTHKADDPVADLAGELGVPVFRGSEGDVLDRTYRAAKTHGADVVVRITADCPAHDPEVADWAVWMLQSSGYDYVSNHVDRTFPDGLDVEAIRFEALETAWREAKEPYDREHVTPYIWKHPERFPQHELKLPQDLSEVNWAVDTEEDLQVLEDLFHRMDAVRKPFGFSDLLKAADLKMTVNREAV